MWSARFSRNAGKSGRTGANQANAGWTRRSPTDGRRWRIRRGCLRIRITGCVIAAGIHRPMADDVPGVVAMGVTRRPEGGAPWRTQAESTCFALAGSAVERSVSAAARIARVRAPTQTPTPSKVFPGRSLAGRSSNQQNCSSQKDTERAESLHLYFFPELIERASITNTKRRFKSSVQQPRGLPAYHVTEFARIILILLIRPNPPANTNESGPCEFLLRHFRRHN